MATLTGIKLTALLKERGMSQSEKGAITLTKELKRTVDRSLAAKEISSTEAAKKYSEVQNSQSGKDEILNEPNVKAADDSHFEGSSDNACL